MLQYVVSQSDNDNFIITIMEGEYKGTAVKIVNLKMAEDGTMDFEIELPKNKTELFENETFKEEISEMVGDVVKKSIEAVYKSQAELSEIETEVGKILDENNVKRDENKLLIETFMSKGLLLKIEEDDDKKHHYVAIDIKTNQVYDLSSKEEFETVRQRVYPNIILN